MVRSTSPPSVIAPPLVAPPVVADVQGVHQDTLRRAPGSCSESTSSESTSPGRPGIIVLTGSCLTGIAFLTIGLYVISGLLTGPTSPVLNHVADASPADPASSPALTHMPQPPKMAAHAVTQTATTSPSSFMGEPRVEPIIPNQNGVTITQPGSLLVTAAFESSHTATPDSTEPTILLEVDIPIANSDGSQPPDDELTRTDSPDVIASIATFSDNSANSQSVTSFPQQPVSSTGIPEDETCMTSLDALSVDAEWAPLSVKDPAVPNTMATMSGTVPENVCSKGQCPTSLPTHGTSLQWANSPAEAYQRATNENKLVFMIHVSGNFKIPGFT